MFSRPARRPQRVLLRSAESDDERGGGGHATKRALSPDFLDGADQVGALGEEELMALIRG